MATKVGDIYRHYKKKTNMGFQEFYDWSKTKCSQMASVDRQPIKRNLVLLGTPKEGWTDWHKKEAEKMLAFEARHSKGKAGKILKECGVSKHNF